MSISLIRNKVKDSIDLNSTEKSPRQTKHLLLWSMRSNGFLWKHLESFLFRIKRWRWREMKDSWEQTLELIFISGATHILLPIREIWNLCHEQGLCLIDSSVSHEVSINSITKTYYLNMEKMYKLSSLKQAHFHGLYSQGHFNLYVGFSRTPSKSYNVCHNDSTQIIKTQHLLLHSCIGFTEPHTLKCL